MSLLDYLGDLFGSKPNKKAPKVDINTSILNEITLDVKPIKETTNGTNKKRVYRKPNPKTKTVQSTDGDNPGVSGSTEGDQVNKKTTKRTNKSSRTNDE